MYIYKRIFVSFIIISYPLFLALCVCNIVNLIAIEKVTSYRHSSFYAYFTATKI